ncbi:MAG: type II secretion system protein GspL, partial [Rubrivivax sp.]
MSTLALLIPPSLALSELTPASAPVWDWIRSDDGVQVTSHGRSPLDALPGADTVVAVLDAALVSWHRIDVPRVPAPRLPAALAGLLEDHLLDEPEHLHFALEPGAQPGRPAWVAVMRGDVLRAAVQALDRAQVDCDRIVPLWAPGAAARGHFHPGPAGDEDDIRLTWAGPEGVVVLPLRGGAARAWLGGRAGPVGAAGAADEKMLGVPGAMDRHTGVAAPLPGASGASGAAGRLPAVSLPGSAQPAASVPSSPQAAEASVPWLAQPAASAQSSSPLAVASVPWSAQPAVVAAAERWLDAAVPLLGEAAVALRAADSPWDLRQFALAPRRRGTRRVAGAWRALRAPAWRPVRIGLVTLVALQVVGLNAWAWQQERALAQRRAEQVTLLREAHPQVRVVLDAPLQMQRETAALRAASGRVGEEDLESALAAAASAWPEGRGPATALQFAPGRLTLAVEGWRDADVAALRSRLRPSGWQVDAAGGRLTLTRSATGGVR